VLDEPTEALDESAEQEFLATLEELHRGDPQRTLLVVTHELGLAAREATHLALFYDGTVLAGPRARVLEAAAGRGEAGVAARLTAAAREHAPRPHDPGGPA